MLFDNGDAGRYKTLEDDIVTLTKKHYDDAGLDIASNENCTIPAHTSKLISTGLILEVPVGCVGLLWSRSGLSVNHRIEVGAGCIDATYRGEVKVHLYNFGDNDFVVSRGDRIAQLLTLPIIKSRYVKIEDTSITNRQAEGFGSTGK